MKYFGVDWGAFIASLPVWERLPREARMAVLKEMKPSQGTSARDLGPAADAVRASGLVEESKTGKRLTPKPEHRPLLLVLRALDRQRIWEVPTTLLDYLLEHFTVEELIALHGQGYVSSGYVDRRALAMLASSDEWLEDFLSADTHDHAVSWERARLPRGESPRFLVPGTWEGTRRLLTELLKEPGPVPLRELPGRFPELDAGTLGRALETGLRYLLLFAGVRDADLEPMVGAWPEAAARLHGGPPAPPVAVEAVESFEAAWLMEDMTTLLVTAAAEPIRLRMNDWEIFARAREAIEARLISLPEWVAEAADSSPEERVGRAVRLLNVLKLAAYRQGGGKNELIATQAGTEWLARSDRERLASLLEPLRASRERNPAYEYSSAASPFGFFPVRSPGMIRDRELDLRAGVERVFLSLPAGTVLAPDFLDYARRSANPLLDRVRAGKLPVDMYWGARRPVRGDWERLWGELLAAFLVHRLAMLGGARLGRTAENVICFALTGAGRYLLGAAEDFEYGHAAEGQVIVQPNFDIVFLAPAPRVEAQLARFAERAGAGPGVMFRLTRASVLAAAEAGMGEAQIVEALRSASSRDLPANVARQLRDWLAGVRRVRTRPALLLECPDAETAGRVRAAAGKGVRPLTDTVLELPDASGKERTALVKKLRAAGIFVG